MKTDHTPILINLLAIAKYDHMPDYPIQFMTKGELTFKNPQEASLAYVEAQEDEETGLITESNILLSVRDGKITMERTGDCSNTMVFSRGQRFEGTYRTPYGELDMAVLTKESSVRLGREDGALHLKYQIHLQGNYASSNELHLEYYTEEARNNKAKGEGVS